MVQSVASNISSIAREVSQLLDGVDICSQQQITHREGTLVGVQVISEPQEHDTFQLSVRVFPRQPESRMSEEDMAESLSACREALHDANWHIRVSALHTLSQLSGEAAVALVQQARQDPEPYVRQAVQHALARIATPRVFAASFAGGCLVLYRYADAMTRVWHQTTNQWGHALFTDLPGVGRYRLRWREHACPPRPIALPHRPASLAAAAAPATDQERALPQVVASTDDSLVCTVTMTADVIELAFESQHEALQEAWVRFDLIYQDTERVVHSGLVLLHAVEGIYEGRYYVHEAHLVAPCTIAFGSIDPASLSAAEAQLSADSYRATDERNRLAWRAWLQPRAPELGAHPAWQAVYALMAEA